MKDDLLKRFGIPPAAAGDIEVRKDETGVPRLWFRSKGNPLVGLDLTGASQLKQQLEALGDRDYARTIAGHIEAARRQDF
jgi:hypothetical protein